MCTYVAIFFLASLINTAVMSLDYTMKEKRTEGYKVQDMLLILQSCLFFCLNIMILMMFWRFTNPLKHKTLFEVSHTMEHNRLQQQDLNAGKDDENGATNLTESEEEERQRTLKRLQAYKELDLLQIKQVLKTMLSVSNKTMPILL